MPDMKKLLSILSESTVAGSVASTSTPVGSSPLKRSEDTIFAEESDVEPTKSSPSDFGLWKNSAAISKEQVGKHGRKKMAVNKTTMYPQLAEAVEPEQEVIDTTRKSRLGSERNAGLDEPDEKPDFGGSKSKDFGTWHFKFDSGNIVKKDGKPLLASSIENAKSIVHRASQNGVTIRIVSGAPSELSETYEEPKDMADWSEEDWAEWDAKVGRVGDKAKAQDGKKEGVAEGLVTKIKELGMIGRVEYMGPEYKMPYRATLQDEKTGKVWHQDFNGGKEAEDWLTDNLARYEQWKKGQQGVAEGNEDETDPVIGSRTQWKRRPQPVKNKPVDPKKQDVAEGFSDQATADELKAASIAWAEFARTADGQAERDRANRMSLKYKALSAAASDREMKQRDQGVAEGSDTAPETVGKFLYNTITKSLNDINIPYQQGTDEYNRFVQSYKKAMADQDRKYLRLGMEPEKLAKYLGIQDGAKWIRKAQGVAEGNPGYNKHSFVGKIRRGREADNKGWRELGNLFAAGDDEKAAEKALRKGNRYYNMTRGNNKTPGGFPKTTFEGVAEGLDHSNLTNVAQAQGKLKGREAFVRMSDPRLPVDSQTEFKRGVIFDRENVYGIAPGTGSSRYTYWLKDESGNDFSAPERDVFVSKQSVAEGASLKKVKREYNVAAKDAGGDRPGAGKKIDDLKKRLRQRDVGKDKSITTDTTSKPRFADESSEITEEMIASRLKNELDLFKKGAKSKDKSIGKKPSDNKEVQPKKPTKKDSE